MRDDARFIRDHGLPAWVDGKLRAAPAPERRLLESRYAAMWRVQDGASIAAAYDAVSSWVQPLDELAGIGAPAVVRGCADDPIHPLALARRLARALDADLLESARLDALDPDRDARVVEMAVRRAGTSARAA
jgi:pimeloyl-ACP methyl ester carboxylesterase